MSAVVVAALSVVPLSVASGTTDAAAAARSGVVTGTVTPTPAAFASRFRPLVLAYRMDVPGDVRSVVPAANGSFRLTLPTGLWAVTKPTWVNGQVSYVGHAVPVTGGGTTAFRSSLRTGAHVAPFRVTTEGWTTGGEFPSETGPGYEDLMAIGLLDAFNKSCGAIDSPAQEAAVVANREGRVFKAIQTEIKLGRSRYADAQARAMAKSAVTKLQAWAPTHKVSGSISSTTTNGVRTDTATVRLVNLKTGRTDWQNTYSKDDDNGFWSDVADTAGADIANALCGVPPGLHISATAEVRGEDEDAAATASLTAEYDVWSRPGEPTNYEVESPVTWTITNSTFTGKGACPKVAGPPQNMTTSVSVGQGAAVISDEKPRMVKVFIASTVQVDWRKTPPPDECTGDGSLLLLFNALNLTVPLNGSASAKGSTMPGVTYDIAAKVTPLTKRP